VAYKGKGVKLEMNSQRPVDNSLNLKSKLNTPMNTIMSIASLSLTCKVCLQVRFSDGTVVYFATVQRVDKLIKSPVIRKFRIAHNRANKLLQIVRLTEEG